MSRLRLVPVDLAEANGYVRALHPDPAFARPAFARSPK